MRDALPQFAAAFAVPLALVLFSKLACRSDPPTASLVSGRTGPARPITAFLICGGTLFGLFGACCFVYGILTADVILLVLSPFFAAFGGFMVWTTIASASPMWHVAWDADGVSGPSTRWALRRTPPRTFIPWSDIADVGVDRSGVRYVEGSDGSRIYWSHLYAGAELFEKALEEHRQ